jgi:hypothetical protein
VSADGPPRPPRRRHTRDMGISAPRTVGLSAGVRGQDPQRSSYNQLKLSRRSGAAKELRDRGGVAPAER